MTIYIARHGQSEANVENRLAYPDTPLTSKGIGQAKSLAEFFSDKNISAVYSSPYRRALDTAKIINEKLKVKIHLVKKFIDTDFGILNGKIIDERWKERVNTPWEYKVPRGENFSDVYSRVIPAFRKIDKKGNIVIVSHRDVIRILVLYLGKIPRKKIMDIDQPHSCIYAYDKKGLRYYIDGKKFSGYFKWQGY